jgi:hypothetical protein
MHYRSYFLNIYAADYNLSTVRFSSFGGLVVSMLASGTQDHGFAPG